MVENILKISIDYENCMGSGNCVLNAPGVFLQDDEGMPQVDNINAQSIEVIEFAALSCPVKAIVVEKV